MDTDTAIKTGIISVDMACSACLQHVTGWSASTAAGLVLVGTLAWPAVRDIATRWIADYRQRVAERRETDTRPPPPST